MFFTNSAIILCSAFMFLNLKLYHMKNVDSDLENPNQMNIPLLSNKFPDSNDMMYNLFPNFNNLGGNQGDRTQDGYYPGNFQNNLKTWNQHSGNSFKNVNVGNYVENPLNTLQANNYPQYPVNNWNDYDNWNNNMYPGTYPKGPSYPNIQTPHFGKNNWNNDAALQMNQNPKQVLFPGNQVQTQTVPQWQNGFGQQNVGLNRQSQYPQEAFQDYSGLQNGGRNPQVTNGFNYQLPDVETQNPNLNFPQVDTTTTEKVAILGFPVIISTEPSVGVSTEASTSLSTSTSAAMKQCALDCKSTSEYNPVCGSNNVTYFNEGRMRCARICGIEVTELRKGACAVGLNPPPFV